MIDRRQLTLVQKTEDGYHELRRKIAKAKGLPNSWVERTLDKTSSYSEITRPLQFKDYEYLLIEAKKTNAVKKISVQIGRKEWEKCKKRDLNMRRIRYMAKLAREKGFLYIGFYSLIYDGPNNEIGFEQDNENVKSTCLQIPGTPGERHLYTWNGSDQSYHKIHGIYVPIKTVSPPQ